MKAEELFTAVTDRLIAEIESGTEEWRTPWSRLAKIAPPQSIHGTGYRGMNYWILAEAGIHNGYSSQLWGTFKGWKDRVGGTCAKGSKSTPVLFWKTLSVEEKDENGNTVIDPETGKPTRRDIPFARVYHVFAAEQVPEAAGLVAARAEERRALVDRPEPDRIAEVEAYLRAVGADIREPAGGSNQAFYAPEDDYIVCPALWQFENAEQFYGTLSHEHGHWTGHRSRLHRQYGRRFGDEAYAAEELVAEMTAAFLGARWGFDFTGVGSNSAGYLRHWLEVLKRDPRALTTVMGAAQRAVDYLDRAAGVVPQAEVEENAA
jgi:antirestriction protein ArdC